MQKGKTAMIFFGVQNLEVFRTAYARNVLAAKQPKEECRIPRIIHQIWLGSPRPCQVLRFLRLDEFLDELVRMGIQIMD